MVEMDSFSSQWLESIGREKFAQQFSSYGYSNFAKCSQLTEEDLTAMNITDSGARRYLLSWAKKLSGREEADVVRDLPVSVPCPFIF